MSASDCCFPLVLLPDASLRCNPAISDKRRFEVIGTAFTHCRLDYCNALLAGITDTKTAAINAEDSGLFSVSPAVEHDGGTTLLVRSLHWLPVQRRIIFKTAVLVWKCIYGVEPPTSARILHAGGESPRMSSTAVGIDWMYRAAKSTDVGRPAQLRLPWANSVEQCAISTA